MIRWIKQWFCHHDADLKILADAIPTDKGLIISFRCHCRKCGAWHTQSSIVQDHP